MLKWLALLFMTIDHLGYYFNDYMGDGLYVLLRLIGRLAFPLFAFYIVKGFYRTSNIFKYLFRIGFFAVLSHFMISFAKVYVNSNVYELFNIEWTNILVLFFFGIIMLMGCDLAMRSHRDMIASMTLLSETYTPKQFNSRYDVKVNPGGISLQPNIGISIGILVVLVSLWSVYILNADYEIYGMLTILFIYLSYDSEEQSIYFSNLFLMLGSLNIVFILMALINRMDITPWVMQSFSILSIYLIKAFEKDNRKSTAFGKYFFYLYYPLHICAFIILSQKFMIK